MRVAVLGLGEAGRIYATDLVARGVTVSAADPFVADAPAGVRHAARIADAVSDAEIVLSLVGASAAESVLGEALPAMAASAIFADMNTGGPTEKKRLAAAAAAAGIDFVDVAILAPVPRARLDTSLLLSGSGASRLEPLLSQLQVPVTDVGPDAGTAGGLKLLRSVFMKGLAALVFESVEAADAAGVRDWVIDQISSELGPDGRALVERLLEGTVQHAVRREAEMHDARDYLESLGADHAMTDATLHWLSAIAAR
ncbi:NAD(P)-dependent oxidoreductase [Parafrigoribacterium soli]|uniref:NAD(P)-dependent oxidoreductase n=1 Tax=Parafrigoribacterium soli TaxID=3144663 RepID=UPI0032EF3479